jgi:hypothetical protein
MTMPTDDDENPSDSKQGEHLLPGLRPRTSPTFDTDIDYVLHFTILGNVQPRNIVSVTKV